MGFRQGQDSEFTDQGVAEQLEIVGSDFVEGEHPAPPVDHLRRALRLEHALAGGERDVKDHVFGERGTTRDGKAGTSHRQLETAAHCRAAVRFDEPVVVEEEAWPPSPPTTIEPR